MNVLLTCAGRRNYLLEYFRRALEGRGHVFAADRSDEAPAMQEADRAFIVPDVEDPKYIAMLVDLCVREKVRLVVSLNDLELPLLSRAKQEFFDVGVQVAVSEPEVVETCFDKWKTCRFLGELGLRTPKTFVSLEEAKNGLKKGAIDFPLIVKPRWGTASIGIEFTESERELELAYELAGRKVMRTFLAEISAQDQEQCVLIQEELPGNEYGVDLVNDLKGEHQATFVKRKLAMRAGETDRAVTETVPVIEGAAAQIARALRHVGVLDCDFFWDGESVSVLEMNPRFGGGYPFSQLAGADIPAALIAWAYGESPAPGWLKVREGVAGAKCDRVVEIAREFRSTVTS